MPYLILVGTRSVSEGGRPGTRSSVEGPLPPSLADSRWTDVAPASAQDDCTRMTRPTSTAPSRSAPRGHPERRARGTRERRPPTDWREPMLPRARPLCVKPRCAPCSPPIGGGSGWCRRHDISAPGPEWAVEAVMLLRAPSMLGGGVSCCATLGGHTYAQSPCSDGPDAR